MNYKEVLKKVGAALLALTFWEIAALLIHQRILLVTPVAVARRLCTIWRVEGFARAIWFSFYHIAGGFLLGLILGCLLAYLAAKHPVVETLLWPWMAMIKSVPVASFVVLALVWIARDWLPVFISLLMVLPVVWSNVCTGIRSADPALLELARVYGWPRGRILRRIYLPGVRPHFLAALRSGIGFGWKSAIAAEVLTVPRSAIGRMIYESKLYLQTTDLFAWTLAVILLSVGLERLVLRALTPRGKGGGST